MIDETWQLFSQTGNIEAYLLFKSLENETDTNDEPNYSVEESGAQTKM